MLALSQLPSGTVVAANGKVTKKGDEIFNLPLAGLIVDPDYQRRLNRVRIEKMAREWDERLAGALVVSARADGTFYIIDGQHRYEALQILGRKHMVCFVFAGLTREQEADLFVDLNTVRKAVRTDDRFRARVVARDKVALKVVEIASMHGFSVVKNNGLDDLQNTATLEVILSRYGDRVLSETLRAIRAIWPGERKAREAEIVGGLGLFLGNYLGEASWERLVSRMQLLPAAQLVREARGMLVELGRSGAARGASSGEAFGTAQVMTARLIRDYYNRGTRKQLPELKAASGKNYPLAARGTR